jgi:DNA mismatch repair protein MutS
MIINNKKEGLKNNLKNEFNFYAIHFKKEDNIGYIILSKDALKEKVENFCENFQEEFELITEKQTNECKEILVSTCIICGRPVTEVSKILKEKSTEINFEKNIQVTSLPLCEYHNNLILEGKMKIKGIFTTSNGTELGYEEE